MTTENSVYDHAKQYVAAGLSILPISSSGNKKPCRNLLPVTGHFPDGNPRRGWNPLKRRQPTPEELGNWYTGWGPRAGVAVICGSVSGGLETIDVDETGLIEPWLNTVRASNPDLLEKLVLVQTPRPGLHVYYRHAILEGSQILARTIQTNPETQEVKVKKLIETRGEGGYAIVPPTPYYCHPSKRPYVYRSARTLADVSSITDEERAFLFEVSRSFDRTPPRPPEPPRPTRPSRQLDTRRPGDDFDSKANWSDLLTKHGWRFSQDVAGVQHWTRPGKSEGTSATVNHEDCGKLFVFTSDAHPLEQERMYTKFEFLTFMEFEGDFTASAQALRDKGYGQSFDEFPRQRPPARRSRGRESRRAR